MGLHPSILRLMLHVLSHKTQPIQEMCRANISSWYIPPFSPVPFRLSGGGDGKYEEELGVDTRRKGNGWGGGKGSLFPLPKNGSQDPSFAPHSVDELFRLSKYTFFLSGFRK